MAHLTRALEADGEIVWSWHPHAGVKFVLTRAGDGGKSARLTEESAYKP